jgi:Ca2+-binding EF-hand superfamily protein
MMSRHLKNKHDKEKKDLAQYLALQEEMYQQREKQWEQEYRKLYKAYDELEKETVERDYEEFKAPDTNNDDMISRAEFNTYVHKYLSSFPELSEKDFPKFEEFDLNSDGNVSFDEWQNFLVLQKQMEAQKAEKEKKGGTALGDNAVYAELLNALYDQSNSADSFSELNRHIAAGAKGKTTRGAGATAVVGAGAAGAGAGGAAARRGAVF